VAGGSAPVDEAAEEGSGVEGAAAVLLATAAAEVDWPAALRPVCSGGGDGEEAGAALGDEEPNGLNMLKMRRVTVLGCWAAADAGAVADADAATDAADGDRSATANKFSVLLDADSRDAMPGAEDACAAGPLSDGSLLALPWRLEGRSDSGDCVGVGPLDGGPLSSPLCSFFALPLPLPLLPLRGAWDVERKASDVAVSRSRAEESVERVGPLAVVDVACEEDETASVEKSASKSA